MIGRIFPPKLSQFLKDKDFDKRTQDLPESFSSFSIIENPDKKGKRSF